MFYFKKEKYLNCYFMKHSLHFFHDSISACCTNVSGPVFYPNYKSGNVDWNYIFNVRKKYISKINSIFSKEEIPECCNGCYEINSQIQSKKVDKFENIVTRLYFHNNMSCNAKCIYCTYKHIDRGYRYKVLPLINSLLENNLLSKDAVVYMSGGEITIYPEFDEMMDKLQKYLNSKIEILTSGIKYCKSIENAFVSNKCKLIISLDSGTRETYKKIKQVDCFDTVVSNLQKYSNASENVRDNVILKYILIDNYNDNKDEIRAFIDLVLLLKIKNVRLDIDYEKYKLTENIKVPDYYFELISFFNNLAQENDLTVNHCEQVDAILNKL